MRQSVDTRTCVSGERHAEGEAQAETRARRPDPRSKGGPFVRTVLKKKLSQTTETMDAQFNTNVYHFTSEVMTLLLEKFDGKVVGSEEMDMGLIMKEFFGDFKPGDKVVPPVEEDEEKKVSGSKKKKKKKAAGEPKRPTTAFFFYTASIRTDVTKANPGKSVGELSKIYGQMWADLSDEDKKPFKDKNEKDKERYAKEMEAFKAKVEAEKDE